MFFVRELTCNLNCFEMKAIFPWHSFYLEMADEALARAGLHFDELNKIRVLEPEVAQQTVELKEECKEFVDSMYVNMSNGATVINYNIDTVYITAGVCN